MHTLHVVGAAILDGDRILAAQRSEKMKSPLKWEFPGGKLEQGETHAQALERELQEELGIRIRVGAFVATGYEVTPGREVRLHVYEAEIAEGIPKALEHAQLRWVHRREMKDMDWAAADLPAVDALLGNYGRDNQI